jgi:hypothetical protein
MSTTCRRLIVSEEDYLFETAVIACLFSTSRLASFRKENVVATNTVSISTEIAAFSLIVESFVVMLLLYVEVVVVAFRWPLKQ